MKDKQTNVPYILFDKEAQDALLTGVTLMYKAVCTTLSPKGRNVAIQRPWGAPIVIHDGVTVAREVKSRDRFVQQGINLIKEAAQKTNDEAGDGTTTSTLIAYEVVSRGMKLKEQGINPMVLRDEVQRSLSEAKEKLAKLSKKVKTVEELSQVATISSANKEIGELVGKVIFDMGSEGLVTVEEGGGTDTWVDRTDGMSIARGYSHPYFVTDTYRQEATVVKPIIIMTDRAITNNLEITSLIQKLVEKGEKNIVIIGEVTGEALSTLVLNKTRGNINCLVVKAPGYGDHKAGFLEDVAMVVGGKVFSKEMPLEMFDESFLGHADKMIADAKSSIIIGGKGDPNEVKEQVAKLQELKRKAVTGPEREPIEERIAKLTTGVAVIRVGAKTEVEAREKIERVKDAVGAAQSALEEGIVAGGGVTFIKLIDAITEDTSGAKLLKEVLEQPMRKVMLNCGESQQSITDAVGDVKKSKSTTYGYEAMSGEMCELIERGIIDPAKVIRLSLENGIAVATSILTTEVLIDQLQDGQ